MYNDRTSLTARVCELPSYFARPKTKYSAPRQPPVMEGPGIGPHIVSCYRTGAQVCLGGTAYQIWTGVSARDERGSEPIPSVSKYYGTTKPETNAFRLKPDTLRRRALKISGLDARKSPHRSEQVCQDMSSMTPSRSKRRRVDIYYDQSWDLS